MLWRVYHPRAFIMLFPDAFSPLLHGLHGSPLGGECPVRKQGAAAMANASANVAPFSSRFVCTIRLKKVGPNKSNGRIELEIPVTEDLKLHVQDAVSKRNSAVQ